MYRKITVFSITVLLMISLCTGAFAESGGLTLEHPAVNEMFTQRDFDPSFKSAVDIILKDTASSAKGEGVRIDGDTVTITHEGVYRLSGSLSDGQVVVYAPEAAKVQLVLDGVSVTNEGGAAVHVVQADKVFVSTAKDSENSLSSVGRLRDEDVDGAVYSKADICFNGEGKLYVSSEEGHGIATKDDLKICSGSYEIAAEKRGLSGKDSIRIGGGDIRIRANGDGLHSEHDKADKGYIFISGGKLHIVSAKDGIDCTNYLEVLSGNICIEASSDGINVAGADDRDKSAAVIISGGIISVKALEDGIDANGSISFHGGELYISAAPRGGDGALDYGSAAEISGGIVAAACAGDMAVNFSEAAAQVSILCHFSKSHCAGEEIQLFSETAELLLSFKPEYDYQAVVLSCDTVTADGKYTVRAGDETVEIEMDSSLWGSGLGPMGPGMLPPPGTAFPEMPEGMGRPELPRKPGSLKKP